MAHLQAEQNQPKPSITSPSVAMGFWRALMMRTRQSAFSNIEITFTRIFFEEAIKQLSGFTWVLAKVISLLPLKLQRWVAHKIAFPFYDERIFLRKLFISKQADDLINNKGIEQVLILAGGADDRGLVLSLKSKCKVYELDRNPTRQSKLSGLRKLSTMALWDNNSRVNIAINSETDHMMQVNDNYFLIDFDYEKNGSLRSVVEQYGFDCSKKTLVIGEGLTVYLTEAENIHLLNDISEITTKGSHVLMSYVNELTFATNTARRAQTKSGELYKFFGDEAKVKQLIQDKKLKIIGKYVPAEHVGEIVQTHDPMPIRQCEQYYLLKHKVSNDSDLIQTVNELSVDTTDLEKLSMPSLF